MINILPEFESRQVLSSDELNWLTCYLDSQNRYSRKMLIGCGLIAGLQVRYNTAANAIQVSNGCGLTSAGHIVSLANDLNITSYTKAKKYEIKPKDKLAFPYLCDDMEKNYTQSVEVPSFYFSDFKDEVLELFEDTVNGVPPISFNSVNGKVAMLFAEIVQKELKDCEEDNCQERGKKYIFNTKVLLISQQDALLLLQRQYEVNAATTLDAIRQKAFPWLYLPNLNILKPVLGNINIANGFTEQIIINEYTRCINDFVKNIPKSIDAAINNLISFNAVIPSTITFSTTIQQVVNALLSNANAIFAYQTVYDYLWTIVKSYQELQLEAQRLKASSKVIGDLFPNHILLGTVSVANNNFDNNISTQENIYRHIFYSRYTQSIQAAVSKNISVLTNRLKALLVAFDTNVLSDTKEIKLNAGANINYALSQQSIPYYLKASVADVWSQYAQHLNLAQYISSYYNINESKQSSSANPYNEQPASFQSNFGFYRIEGVHGKVALTALNTVFQLRKKYALPIEVLMLRLNEEAPFNHSFNLSINEDVESMYQVVRAELNKQINLTVSYLGGLRFKSGVYANVKKNITDALKSSYFNFWGSIKDSLIKGIVFNLENTILANNIVTHNGSDYSSFLDSDAKFKSLVETVSKTSENEKASTNVLNLKNITAKQYAQESKSYLAQNALKASYEANYKKIDYTFLPILFLNTLGSLVADIKNDNNFKNSTNISFYTQLMKVAKEMQSNIENKLFFMCLHLYCALQLQKEYLPENFLEFDIEKYNKNLDNELLTISNTIITYVKSQNTLVITNDSVLTGVVKGEILDYADRIKYDDDWVKIIQIDAENKKRNGGLGVENLLERFVQLHPGITHGCGVPAGGTYIMVYNKDNKVVSDFYLPYIISSHLRPIQYTLLENKTLTLSGTIRGEDGILIEANIKIGSNIVFANKEGYFNSLISENTTLKVVASAQGFVQQEKEIEIKDASIILDFVLKKEEVIKVAKTITFQNQLEEVITADINLLNLDTNKIVVAPKGKLSIEDDANKVFTFTVQDDNFEELKFGFSLGTTPSEEVVKLIELRQVIIHILDKANGAFNLELLKKYFLNDGDTLTIKDKEKGILISKDKYSISLKQTAEIIYDGQQLKQEVKSNIAQNEIVFNKISTPTTVKINSWVALKKATVIRRALVNDTKILLNNTPINISSSTLAGSASVQYSGTLNLDSNFVNAPIIKIDGYEKINGVIVYADTTLITKKTDISKTKSYLAFTRKYTAEEVKEILETDDSIRTTFSLIHRSIDMTKDNFYCFLFTPETLSKLKEIFKL